MRSNPLNHLYQANSRAPSFPLALPGTGGGLNHEVRCSRQSGSCWLGRIFDSPHHFACANERPRWMRRLLPHGPAAQFSARYHLASAPNRFTTGTGSCPCTVFGTDLFQTSFGTSLPANLSLDRSCGKMAGLGRRPARRGATVFLRPLRQSPSLSVSVQSERLSPTSFPLDIFRWLINPSP